MTTTTQRGLGWSHQKIRLALLRAHIDGTPCPCLTDNQCGPSCPCRPTGHGQPMHRQSHLNIDGMPLEADHELARTHGGTRANRLLLFTCNRSRGGVISGRRQTFLEVVTSRNW